MGIGIEKELSSYFNIYFKQFLNVWQELKSETGSSFY